MDSLPEHRIGALPGATRQEAYWKIEALCLLRRRAILSEDQIAEKAKFGSAEAMHQQLRTWGLTGLLPPEKQEEAPKLEAVGEEPKQKARSSSPPEEVPDASAAADLFSEALDGLARAVEDLEYLPLVYQGRRFGGAYTFESNAVVRQSDVSREKWEYLCERYGRDPEAEGHLFPSQLPVRASRYPPRDVVALIAAYALSGRSMEPLLDVLYPEHSQEDVEKVNNLLYEPKRGTGSKDGLLRTAQQFAAAVYGRAVRKGKRPDIPAEDYWLACSITERREAGIPDEKIRQKINEGGRELTEGEFNRLADLELDFPNT